VGRIIGADATLLDLLISGGFLPVIACLAGDRQGRFYNVNADQMAVACAVAFGSESLIFLTDVEGVLDSRKRLLSSLTPAGIDDLIASGAATGGMLAKLNAAQSGLRQGVPEVRIAAGAEEAIVERILAGESSGTRLSQ
jgi:acetylglutamate kinase